MMEKVATFKSVAKNDMTDLSRPARKAHIAHWRSFRIAFSFFAISVLYIVMSDRFLLWLGTNPQWLTSIQTYKGIGFISVTALVIYFVVRRELSAALESEESAQKARADLALLNQELETRISERTHELADANSELRRFTDAVSHDLRTPLRTIGGFAAALVEDFGDSMDDVARDYAQRIQAATKRSGQIVEDLLALSRSTSKPMHKTKVDITRIAQKILQELSARDPDRLVEWQIESHIFARGDDGLLTIVLENLLDNAWKFTDRSTQAVIEVGRQGNALFVKDNGASFEPEIAKRIFEDFARGVTSVEGTGIGLATVKRIIERHGGKIWAEPQPGVGTTIFFELPDMGTI